MMLHIYNTMFEVDMETITHPGWRGTDFPSVLCLTLTHNEKSEFHIWYTLHKSSIDVQFWGQKVYP